MLFKMKKMLGRIGQEKGFSLVEVLMATLLLTIGILAYGKTSSSVMGTNTQSTKESVAITLAQDQIEQFKNSGFTVTGGTPVSETVDANGDTGAASTPYTRTWEIDELLNGADGLGIYEVRVTVGWNNMGDREVTLNTRISDRP
jgi:type IV pilus assembly protein PilV